jgi:hypothetical protein
MLVGSNDAIAALEDQPREALALLSPISGASGVFPHRAPFFARNDRTPLASFDRRGSGLRANSTARKMAVKPHEWPSCGQ